MESNEQKPAARGGRIARGAKMAVSALALAAVGYFLLFVQLTVRVEDGALHLSDGALSRETIACADITAVEWRDSLDRGTRVFGVGGGRTASGRFSNGEFGAYTLYVYSAVPQCVVVRHAGGVAVVNAATQEATRALYDALTAAQASF